MQPNSAQSFIQGYKQPPAKISHKNKTYISNELAVHVFFRVHWIMAVIK